MSPETRFWLRIFVLAFVGFVALFLAVGRLVDAREKEAEVEVEIVQPKAPPPSFIADSVYCIRTHVDLSGRICTTITPTSQQARP